MTRKREPHQDPPLIGSDVDEPTSSHTSTLSRARRNADVAEGHIRHRLERAPTTAAIDITKHLPEVEAPSLEDLSVTVPAPALVSPEQILARFSELRRARAEVQERREGEPVEPGDEVLVDLVGYHAGRVLPFSVRTRRWLFLDARTEPPGLVEGLVGTPVGSSTTVEATLSDTHPTPALEGARSVFAITLHAARKVSLPDETDPVLLDDIGLGASLEETMDGIARMLEDELIPQLYEEARQLVLDEVGLRARMDLPELLIDEEIRRRWHEREGRHLVSMGVSLEDQEAALSAWRSDSGTRAEVERSLRVSLSLGAIAKRDGIVVDKEALLAYLEGMAEGASVPLSDLVDAVRQDPSLQKLLSDKLLHLLTVEHVMRCAEVRFEGAS